MNELQNVTEGTFNEQIVQEAVAQLLMGLGINWVEDPNFKDTPRRVMRVFKEMCSGLYEEAMLESFLSKTFPCDHDEMVFSGRIKAVSLCPHHLLPVLIDAYIGYIPDSQVVGLSKMPRLVQLFASKPLLQEQLTSDVADAMQNISKGCGVIIRGRHLCMEVRGVKQPNAVTVTSAVRGTFKENPDVKQEFMELVKLSREEV